jgi:aryl-alcohol dehydrogenase-like predicted oxidoreductase
MTIERVGLIGVGLMGHGIGKNMLAKGYDLFVMAHHNRGPVDDLVSKGASERTTAQDIAAQADMVRFSPENLAANRPVVDLLKRVAERKNATPAQIALAWLLAQKPFIVPIPDTRNIDHLNENLGAINIALTPADLGEIDTAFSKIKVHGGRMNEEQMKIVDQTV